MWHSAMKGRRSGSMNFGGCIVWQGGGDMACSGQDTFLVLVVFQGIRLNEDVVCQRGVSLRVKTHGVQLTLTIYLGPFPQ